MYYVKIINLQKFSLNSFLTHFFLKFHFYFVKFNLDYITLFLLLVLYFWNLRALVLLCLKKKDALF